MIITDKKELKAAIESIEGNKAAMPNSIKGIWAVVQYLAKKEIERKGK